MTYLRSGAWGRMNEPVHVKLVVYDQRFPCPHLRIQHRPERIFVAATWLTLLETNSVQVVTLLLLSGKITLPASLAFAYFGAFMIVISAGGKIAPPPAKPMIHKSEDEKQ